jgi:hypothetical protein
MRSYSSSMNTSSRVGRIERGREWAGGWGGGEWGGDNSYLLLPMRLSSDELSISGDATSTSTSPRFHWLREMQLPGSGEGQQREQ